MLIPKSHSFKNFSSLYKIFSKFCILTSVLRLYEHTSHIRLINSNLFFAYKENPFSLVIDDKQHVRDLGFRRVLKSQDIPTKRKFVRKFLEKIINLYEIKNACSRHFVKKISADITEFFTKGENLNLTLTLKKGTILYASLRLRSRLVT